MCPSKIMLTLFRDRGDVGLNLATEDDLNTDLVAVREPGAGTDRLAGLELALLGELFQLLHQPAYRLLILLAELVPHRIVGLAVLLVLPIGGQSLQLG